MRLLLISMLGRVKNIQYSSCSNEKETSQEREHVIEIQRARTNQRVKIADL